MNELQIFDYNEAVVRVIDIDGEPWWVLKDICNVLGLSDTNKVAERLDEDELTRIKLLSGGQNREMYVVNEPGLYNVVLRSDKPEAKAFKRWITHEVLPQIRKTGSYNASGIGFEERLKIAHTLTKCTKYTLPYVTEIFKPYLPDAVHDVYVEPEPKRKARKKNAHVRGFLNGYGSVLGKPTNEVYTAYHEHCSTNHIDPVSIIEFSKLVKSPEDVRVIDKKSKVRSIGYSPTKLKKPPLWYFRRKTKDKENRTEPG